VRTGNGVITGGALGVDYVAAETVLKCGRVQQLKIFLPISLKAMCDHYKRRAEEGIITRNEETMITEQLRHVQALDPMSIYDKTPYAQANIKSYYARNTMIVEACGALFAFQVNKSKGTQDAIDKARTLGKPVFVKEYVVETNRPR